MSVLVSIKSTKNATYFHLFYAIRHEAETKSLTIMQKYIKSVDVIKI